MSWSLIKTVHSPVVPPPLRPVVLSEQTGPFGPAASGPDCSHGHGAASENLLNISEGSTHQPWRRRRGLKLKPCVTLRSCCCSTSSLPPRLLLLIPLLQTAAATIYMRGRASLLLIGPPGPASLQHAAANQDVTQHAGGGSCPGFL